MSLTSSLSRNCVVMTAAVRSVPCSNDPCERSSSGSTIPRRLRGFLPTQAPWLGGWHGAGTRSAPSRRTLIIQTGRSPQVYGQWSRSEQIDGVHVTRLRHYVPTQPSPLPRALSEASFGVRQSLARWGRPAAIVACVSGSDLVCSRAPSGAPHPPEHTVRRLGAGTSTGIGNIRDWPGRWFCCPDDPQRRRMAAALGIHSRGHPRPFRRPGARGLRRAAASASPSSATGRICRPCRRSTSPRCVRLTAGPTTRSSWCTPATWV